MEIIFENHKDSVYIRIEKVRGVMPYLVTLDGSINLPDITLVIAGLIRAFGGCVHIPGWKHTDTWVLDDELGVFQLPIEALIEDRSYLQINFKSEQDARYFCSTIDGLPFKPYFTGLQREAFISGELKDRAISLEKITRSGHRMNRLIFATKKQAEKRIFHS